jgi:predicted nucleotidyltransferase component of viral defense system
MKTYRQTTIRRAEIAQVILLHQLYMQPGSHDMIFQGGTAIRWCYGGSRFSEDLDFVTPLHPFAIRRILDQALNGVEKTMIPHFGVGALKLTAKSKRDDTLKLSPIFIRKLPERTSQSNSNSRAWSRIKDRKQKTMCCLLFLPFPI